MRYPATEKLEIIRLVERSHLPVRRTLRHLGVPKTSFYRWYDRYQSFGEQGLEDRNSAPGRVWNRIPDDVREQIVELALDEPELSPRELAVTFTDIAEFDGTAAKSEYEKLQIRQDTLSVRAERFRAFAEGREPRFPQTSHNMTTLIHEELNVLGAKNTDRIERLGLIDQQIKSFRGEISAFQAELQVKQRLLKLAADEVSIYKKLEHSKNVSAIKLLAGC